MEQGQGKEGGLREHLEPRLSAVAAALELLLKASLSGCPRLLWLSSRALERGAPGRSQRSVALPAHRPEGSARRAGEGAPGAAALSSCSSA